MCVDAGTATKMEIDDYSRPMVNTGDTVLDCPELGKEGKKLHRPDIDDPSQPACKELAEKAEAKGLTYVKGRHRYGHVHPCIHVCSVCVCRWREHVYEGVGKADIDKERDDRGSFGEIPASCFAKKPGHKHDCKNLCHTCAWNIGTRTPHPPTDRQTDRRTHTLLCVQRRPRSIWSRCIVCGRPSTCRASTPRSRRTSTTRTEPLTHPPTHHTHGQT